jgi:transposase-like protein
MRAYAVELRVAIVEALGDGLSTSEAARRFGVSVSSVKRFRAQYQQTGDLAPRPPIPDVLPAFGVMTLDCVSRSRRILMPRSPSTARTGRRTRAARLASPR